MMTKQTHFCEHSLARATYARPVFFLDAGEVTVPESLSSFLSAQWGHQLKIVSENIGAGNLHLPLKDRESCTELIVQISVMLEQIFEYIIDLIRTCRS